MSENSTSIYLPIETYNKLQRLQTAIGKILDKKPRLYQVIEMLMELQLVEVAVEKE
jgi:hypothetical protein